MAKVTRAPPNERGGNRQTKPTATAPHLDSTVKERPCLGATTENSYAPRPALLTACYPCFMKVSEMLRLLQQDGWALVATRGSHRQYKHGTKPGRVTIPGKPSDDLAPGTQNSILKQAGLK